ncbi:MAG: cytochrome b/b6 domain-containing protein [Uliginosibacterium sp.]|nr:cytochrome b/b6 domain-containing protein [Uliginosibacterium sp.]
MTDTQAATRKIRLWDLPLRLFHWSLLLLVVGAVVSAEIADEVSGAMDWHPRFGYAILTLLLFRLIWGFVGGTHARFSNFVRGPAAVAGYLRLFRTHRAPSIGHNPLGALSVVALLTSLLLQAVSGLFLNVEDFGIEGPLFKHVSNAVADVFWEIHEINPGVLIALVALHVAAILFYRIVKREDLVTPMLTGNKRVPEGHAESEAQGGSVIRGAVVLALAALAVWFIANKV